MKKNHDHSPAERIEPAPDTALTPRTRGSEQVGALLRELRDRRNMSAEDLANHLGVSRTTVSHWERGRRNPPRTPHFARALFNILDPNEAEREQLLKRIVGGESTDEQTQSDEAFYGEMLRRTDLMMRLGAQIVAMQTELDREVAHVRSAVLDRFLQSDQSVTLEETRSNED